MLGANDLKISRKLISRIALLGFLGGSFLSFPMNFSASAAPIVVNCGTSGTYTISDTGTVSSNSNCKGSVTFTNDVKNIGNGAFLYNHDLTNISFSSTVETITQNAFYGADFTSITFVEGLKTIGNNAFYGTNRANRIEVDVVLPNSLTSIGSGAFNAGNWGEVTIGTGVTTIPATLFNPSLSNTVAPRSVTFLGSSLTNLGANSFSNYRGDEFIIPNSVTTLGQSHATKGTAVDGAANLRYLHIPSGVTTLYGGVLQGNTSLVTLILPDNATEAMGDSFGSSGAPALENVIYCGTDSTILNDTFPNAVQPFCGKAVIFMPNGGTGNTPTLTSTTGTPRSISANSFVKSGFEFDSWNTKKDGTGTTYTSGQSYAFNAHMVLYAKWRTCTSCGDISFEARKKRQAAIDAARNALVAKIKAGETIVNSDFIAADVTQFNSELARRANADFQLAAKSKSFGFADVKTIVTKWGIYQDIQNGVRSNVTGRLGYQAGIIPGSVKLKQTLIAQLMNTEASERSSVEKIDALIAKLAKKQTDQEDRKVAIINKIASGK